MAKPEQHDPEHDWIFDQLPWFVNQTLEPSERRLVSQHLSQCDTCQHEVRLLGSLNESVRTDAEHQYREHANEAKDLASVMNLIEAEPDRNASHSAPLSSLIQKLKSGFSLSNGMPHSRWAATALAGLLVAVLGFQLYYGQSGDDYSVLSSSEVERTSMRLTVEVLPSIDRASGQSVIRGEFEKLGQQIEIENAGDGLFIIALENELEPDQLNALLVALNNDARISRAELLP